MAQTRSAVRSDDAGVQTVGTPVLVTDTMDFVVQQKGQDSWSLQRFGARAVYSTAISSLAV